MSSIPWNEKKYCVVFADIRGYTKLCEQHGSMQVAMILGDWFVLTYEEVIQKHGGIIDKFIGDCMMSIFDRTEDAFLACCDLVDWSKKIDEHLNMRGWLGMGFSIGIGMETGDLVEGVIKIGGEKHVLRVGDAVNMASRLCEVAEPWEILIGEGAYGELKTTVRSNVLSRVRRKRKKSGEYVCWRRKRGR